MLARLTLQFPFTYICVCNRVRSVSFSDGGLSDLDKQQNGTSVDDSARKSNNWLDQWHSGKLGTGSRVSKIMFHLLEFSPYRTLSRRQMTLPFCC